MKKIKENNGIEVIPYDPTLTEFFPDRSDM